MKKNFKKISEKFIKKTGIIRSKNTKRNYSVLENEIDDSNNVSIPKPIKLRNPGIDLGRILSMYAIIVHHILHHGKAMDKYYQYKELRNLNLATYWHINNFIFISGYIGYKTTKYSNLFYYWLCIVFYTISIKKYFSKFKPHLFNRQIEFNDFFPVINYHYWYFTSYFGMYLFLPVINTGLESINKSKLKIAVLSFIFVFIVMKDYINPSFDPFQLNKGYSVLWLLIFYITGAYFGKFNKNNNVIKKEIKIIIYILIFYYSTYLCIKLPNYPINYYSNKQRIKNKIKIFLNSIFIMRVNSFAMILQSLSIMLFLTIINYNKYIAKIITFIGPLTFGIFLIHENNMIRKIMISNIFENYSSQLPLNTIIKIILLRALKIFGICLIIDYLRNILFRILQIRKILMIIEKLLFKLFG